MSTHTHITQYKIDDETVHHVDLLEYDYEDETITRRTLSNEDRVSDPGEDYELLGLVEDYREPATVWGVYEHLHSGAWCVREFGQAPE